MPSREGSPNKNRAFLNARLKEMFGKDFEPIIKAAENAVRMQQLADASEEMSKDEDLDIESRIAGQMNEFNQRKECVNAWEKIGQYISPKLKAVEITGEGGDAIQIKLVNYADSDS